MRLRRENGDFTIAVGRDDDPETQTVYNLPIGLYPESFLGQIVEYDNSEKVFNCVITDSVRDDEDRIVATFKCRDVLHFLYYNPKTGETTHVISE